ncbi:MAG: type II toxin-antitoxin system VapC family toxin [Chloroflexota bacterium]
MARAQILDTTVLIRATRDPSIWDELFHSIESGRVWLSSVVIAELYAGTRSREDSQLVSRIFEAMHRIDRVLTPTSGDWVRAGRMINRRIRLHGDLRPRDHLADVLILLSAARLNGAVVTASLGHFAAWASLARDAGLDVAVSAFGNGS